MSDTLAKQLHLPRPYRLEGGDLLPEVTIAYHTFGTLAPSGDNVIWVFHALTANSNPVEWWPGLVGEGFLFDPATHFIVCANILGSCYGTTGPASVNPATGERYGMDFPEITIGDIVGLHQELKHHLGIEKIRCGIGGSMGGQQLLEWAIREPQLFDLIIPIATNAQHSAWGIAFNTAQRMALEADPTLNSKNPDAGHKGLEAARAIGMLSYRNQETYNKTQTDQDDRVGGFSADSYQRYQGVKLSRRFNPHAYYSLSKTMDSHNVGRNRNSVELALRQIESNVLAISISSDLLFPPQEQELIARSCRHGKYATIDSLYGHDGFLIETEKLTGIIQSFLELTV
ncbi:homoserine O-acetyltransferase family protein [Fulvivirga sedimenti]|uniref:Homoserine O-acetyltransferase n=1 Tax=Fulvivirga sedimenti TaxID=2879465 RepID=A0A9X1HWR8_9BACT|nr:homoserine O-acetyltransferase [Fulvivirga sedimenti]MCA6079046.1 homoserine O-acetyltransferase [Fulvivirga sedimenti]